MEECRSNIPVTIGFARDWTFCFSVSWVTGLCIQVGVKCVTNPISSRMINLQNSITERHQTSERVIFTLNARHQLISRPLNANYAA